MQQVEVRIKGLLRQDWSGWFASLSVANAVDGHTVLSGMVRDQSALYGLLEKLSSLGLQLVSVAVTSSSVHEEAQDVKRAA